MGRKKYADHPKYHVLSGRFSEEENVQFRALAKLRGISISELVRESMLAWKEGNRKVS